MLCLHPHCPMSAGTGTWATTLDNPLLKLRAGTDKALLLADLDSRFNDAPSVSPLPRTPPRANKSRLERLLEYCPCLFNQIDEKPTARAIVHLCELALGTRITDKNVAQAFAVQHPKTPGWKYPPAVPFKGMGGAVMEFLCSEVLTSGGIPPMQIGPDRWPEWTIPGHIPLNQGKMSELKALGDILIPCAPTNIIISVKSEKAKERLLYSANSIEGIGFGFFDTPNEFWTIRRMQLFKRMGFSAIYMPDATLSLLNDELTRKDRHTFAVNINGTALYRPLSQFTGDMLRIVGKSAFDL